MSDIENARKSYFARPPYKAETFKTGYSAVVNETGVNCAVFNEFGKTLTDPMTAKIIADRWNNL